MVFLAESLLPSYCEDCFATASLGQALLTSEDQKESLQLNGVPAFRQKSRGDPPSPPPQPPPSPTGWSMGLASIDHVDVVYKTCLVG